MSVIKKYSYEIIMAFNTLLSGSYLWLHKRIAKYFSMSGNPYIMIWFYVAYPMLWGICLGISIELYKKTNFNRCISNLILIGLNICLIYISWNEFLDFSTYNLILCGILLAVLLFTLRKKYLAGKNE